MTTSLIDHRDVLGMIFSYLDPQTICVCAQVCKNWRMYSHDHTLWTRQCKELWKDKAYIPAQAIQALKAKRGKDAFKIALVDSKRTCITTDELCGVEWSFRFRRLAGPEWVERDPYWNGQESIKVRVSLFISHLFYVFNLIEILNFFLFIVFFVFFQTNS
jgi:hypothetical protein